MEAKTYEKDRFETSQGMLEITFIGHGTLMLEHAGLTVHVDPVSKEADYSSLPKADLVLITHSHPDHLDAAAIRDVRKENTRILGNAGSIAKLGEGIAMGNGDSREVAGLIVEAVPAYNTGFGKSVFHPKGRDNGYLVNFGGLRVYIAGDTEDIPEMSNLPEIDVAFLPVNQPYTMTPEQAAAAARMVNPKVLYPYHYGKTKINRLKDLLDSAGGGIDLRIRSLA